DRERRASRAGIVNAFAPGPALFYPGFARGDRVVGAPPRTLNRSSGQGFRAAAVGAARGLKNGTTPIAPQAAPPSGRTDGVPRGCARDRRRGRPVLVTLERHDAAAARHLPLDDNPRAGYFGGDAVADPCA